MSAGDGDAAVRWFVRTAGVPRDSGYQWLAITEGGDPTFADAVTCSPLAGCDPGQLTDGGHPSLLLARRTEGDWALFVGGLSPRGVPVGRHREIRAVVLGIAPPGADPTPLVAVAGRALADELKDLLPLAWHEGRPRIEADIDWPPSAPEHDRMGAARLDESLGYGAADRLAVWNDIASLTALDLARFPSDRPLVLRTELMEPDRLAALRPWRAVAGRLSAKTRWTRQRDVKEPKTPAGSAGAVEGGGEGRRRRGGDLETGVVQRGRPLDGGRLAGDRDVSAERGKAFWVGLALGAAAGAGAALLISFVTRWRWR